MHDMSEGQLMLLSSALAVGVADYDVVVCVRLVEGQATGKDSST